MLSAQRFFSLFFASFLLGMGFGYSQELPTSDCPALILKVLKKPHSYSRPSDYRPDPPFRGSLKEENDLKTFFAEPLTSPQKATATQKLLELASQKLDPASFKAFSDWLFAQYAEDPQVSFEDSLLGRQKTQFPTGPNRYNQNGERPFDGYLAARAKLSQITLNQIGLEQIKDIHRTLMSRESIREDSGKIFQTDKSPPRNSQGLKDSELGEIRAENVGFEVSGKTLPSGFSAIGKTVQKLEDLNVFVEETRDGFISYAPLSNWRRIDRRYPLSDNLVKKLVRLENQKGSPELKEAQKALLTELSEKIWSEAKASVEKASSRKEAIEAVARFQRNFISVHPFFDGNGRMARLLSEKLLESRGFTPPTYAYWGEDVSLTPYEMEQALSLAVMQSEHYQNELRKALQSGVSFEEVLNPALSRRARELLGDPNLELDGRDFLKFVDSHREELRSFSEAVRKFWKQKQASKQSQSSTDFPNNSDPHFSSEEFLLWKNQQTSKVPVRKQLKQYSDWLKDHTYDDNSGAVRLVSPDFQKSFARLSPSQEEYDQKISRYYSPEKTFRGVPSDKYLSDAELVQLLALPSIFTTGNGVAFQTAHESALPVFQQFNAGLLGDSHFLRQQVIDHKNGTTDHYHMTGMVSFSEKRKVAEHWHRDPREPYGIIFTAQKRLVGVINTAKYTKRLDQLGIEAEFEEALVGGSDPESIMAVDLVQHYPNSASKTPRRMKRASRVSYNRILVRETIFDENDQPRIGPSTLWEISSDGSIRQMTKE